MSDNNTSTLKSYVDSALGTAQSALGSVTGSTGDKAHGELRKDQADTEHAASQASVKLPGATVSASGGAARDNEDRTAGNWNQTVGSAKEALGGLVGNESLKNAGRQQNLEGQQQEAKGQLKDLGDGATSRLQGALGSAVSNVTGDKTGEAHYEQLRADGKAQQRGVEHDLQKKIDAEQQSKQ